MRLVCTLLIKHVSVRKYFPQISRANARSCPREFPKTLREQPRTAFSRFLKLTITNPQTMEAVAICLLLKRLFFDSKILGPRSQKRKISPKSKFSAGRPCGHPAKSFPPNPGKKTSILTPTCRPDVHKKTSVPEGFLWYLASPFRVPFLGDSVRILGVCPGFWSVLHLTFGPQPESFH